MLKGQKKKIPQENTHKKKAFRTTHENMLHRKVNPRMYTSVLSAEYVFQSRVTLFNQ